MKSNNPNAASFNEPLDAAAFETLRRLVGGAGGLDNPQVPSRWRFAERTL